MPSNAQNSKVHKEYYEDGTLKEIGHFDENDQKIGEWKYYNENGKLITTESE